MFNWCQVMSIWLGKPLFEMCCFHMGIARKACQNGLGHFFPTLPRMFVCCCQDVLVHFFSCLPVCQRGGGLKLFEQCPYRIKTFKKGASLTMWSQDELSTREYLCFIRSVIKHKSLGFDLDDLSTVAGI